MTADLDELKARVSAFMEREYSPDGLTALLDGLCDQSKLMLLLARHHVDRQQVKAMAEVIRRKERM